jgi:nucleoside-diphosphate-sugar epimerase
MRIFITGATGYIGEAVAAAFARRGHAVTGLVRSEAKARALNRLEVRAALGDLRSPDSWRAAAAEADVLVHCAVDYGAHEQLDRAAVDTMLAAAGDGRGRAVIYTSGVWLYGDTGGRAVDESSALLKGAIIPWRLEHEKRVLAAATASRRCLVLRPGCVYGGRGGLTGMWFQSAQEKKAAVVAGDGGNRWALVHVEDLAELYALAGESSLSGELLNAVDRSRETVLEMAQAASRAAGAGGKVSTLSPDQARAAFGGLAEGLLLDQEVDGGKAQRLLGWTPRFSGFAADAGRFHLAWKAWSGGA